MSVRVYLKYDLRAPDFATPPERIYAACLDQCEWADQRDYAGVRFHEHHRSPDGYLPSPIVMASVVAGRTRRMALRCSVIVLPLYDAIKVAEDLAVLDIASAGRLEVVVSAGYVRPEFEMFGRNVDERLQLLEDGVAALRQAWTGEEFKFKGRPVMVRPRPYRDRMIPLALGGSSARAAKHAARLQAGFEPAPRKFVDVYLRECERLGHEPGWYPGPGHELRMLHVTRDPERTWQLLKENARHENDSYVSWTGAVGTRVGYEKVDDTEELQRSGIYRLVTPEQCVDLLLALGPDAEIQLHPLMGGMDPDVGWESLELFDSQVLPKLGEGVRP